MQHLNLNLLRSLLVILQQQNVTRAATLLHISQSALSRQFAQLRDYFADPLLLREGNGYVLTPTAKQLLPKLQVLLGQVDDLRQGEDFNPALCQRQFRFAATDYVANFIFPEVMALLHQQAPAVSVEFSQWQPQMLHSMASQQVDMVSTMTTFIPPQLDGILLGKDKPALLMGKQHPLAAKSVTLNSTLEYSFVHLSAGGDKDSFFDLALAEAGLSRRIAYQVPFFAAAFKALEQTDYLLVVPEHIAHNARQQYALEARALPMDNLPEHEYFMLWHQMYAQDQSHVWFREQVSDIIKTSIFSPLAQYAKNA